MLHCCPGLRHPHCCASCALPAGLVSSPAAFQPSLAVGREGATYVRFDVSDLTALPGLTAVALQDRQPSRPRTLPGIRDVDAVVSAISAQDAHLPFRRLVGCTSASSTAPLARSGVSPVGALGRQQADLAAQAEVAARKARAVLGLRIVVLAADNAATRSAMQLAQALVKPGRDLVVLATVVHSPLALASGHQLLAQLEAMARATCVEAVAEVLVKSAPLVEQLQAYVEDSAADLVGGAG